MLNFIRKEKLLLAIIVPGVLLIILGAICFQWMEHFTTGEVLNGAKVGQFGDFVGGVVGSFWALGGVILFYVALKEQREDFKTNKAAFQIQVDALNHQIQEFREQTDEIRNSRKIYEEQSKTQKIQQFESNFYSLLNVYLTIKHNLNSLADTRDYFKNLFQGFNDKYVPNCNMNDHHNVMVAHYVEIFNNDREHLSHYFKTFYRIIKIIDTHPGFDDKDKFFYAKILRSQLTDYEQLLIYYNSHSIFGMKSQPLILKYNLLKHTPLFKKPEFNYFATKQSDHQILFFTDKFKSFLTYHINRSYDIEFDGTDVEEKFDHYDCIVGIYFGDSGVKEVKVICSPDIKQNRINLKEDEFAEYLLCLTSELVSFNTYLPWEKVSYEKFKTDTEKTKIFGVGITTNVRLTLNSDKY